MKNLMYSGFSQSTQILPPFFTNYWPPSPPRKALNLGGPHLPHTKTYMMGL